jgi:hypothetical protein
MKQCFGKIYPDLARLEANKVIAGKVFKVRINLTGMMRQLPQLELDLAEWEDCQRCEQYRSCYDLSNGKILMQRAIAGI